MYNFGGAKFIKSIPLIEIVIKYDFTFFMNDISISIQYHASIYVSLRMIWTIYYNLNVDNAKLFSPSLLIDFRVYKGDDMWTYIMLMKRILWTYIYMKMIQWIYKL